MKNRVLKNCKKHGQSEHGIYINHKNNRIIIRCLECAKDNHRNRYKDPIKRAHDLEYTKNWRIEHPEYNVQYYRKIANKIKLIRDNEVRIFLKENAEKIRQLLLNVNSDIQKRHLNKHCLFYHITSFDEVKKFILNNKRSNLFNDELWKQSSLIKFHHGVRENWNDINEAKKSEIRKEYHKKAHEIVNKKMEELCMMI